MRRRPSDLRQTPPGLRFRGSLCAAHLDRFRARIGRQLQVDVDRARFQLRGQRQCQCGLPNLARPQQCNGGKASQELLQNRLNGPRYHLVIMPYDSGFTRMDLGRCSDAFDSSGWFRRADLTGNPGLLWFTQVKRSDSRVIRWCERDSNAFMAFQAGAR